MSLAARSRAWLATANGPWGRGDVAALLVALTVLAARWGDRSRSILSWDGDTFALATEDYNMDALRPHAPGYPLFVLLGKAFRLAIPEANAALVALSMAFTALALVLMYGLARAVANRALALAAVAILLASPLVYVHSLTANVYTADLACGLAVAWCAWRARGQPNRRNLLALAASLAVAGGVRPSQFFFLTPLAAWGALHGPWDVRIQTANLRRLLAPALLGLGICLAWFLPMAWASGGVAAWRRANKLQSDQIVFADTFATRGWPIVQQNAWRLRLFVRHEWAWLAGPLAVLVVVAAVVALRRHRPLARLETPGRRAVAFLAVWALPAVAFYLVVFDGWNEGPSGYALVILPALVLGALLLARSALAAATSLPREPPALQSVEPPSRRFATASSCLAAAALVAFSVCLWGLASHAHDVADVDYRSHDSWSEAWSHLPESFPAHNTTIVALYNFAHVWWNYPEYHAINYRAPGQGPGQAPDFLMLQQAYRHQASPDWYEAVAAGPQTATFPIDPNTTRLVLFDFQLAGENGGERHVRDDVAIHEAHLPSGWRVLYVDVQPGHYDLADYFTMTGLASPGPA